MGNHSLLQDIFPWVVTWIPALQIDSLQSEPPGKPLATAKCDPEEPCNESQHHFLVGRKGQNMSAITLSQLVEDLPHGRLTLCISGLHMKSPGHQAGPMGVVKLRGAGLKQGVWSGNFCMFQITQPRQSQNKRQARPKRSERVTPPTTQICSCHPTLP